MTLFSRYKAQYLANLRLAIPVAISQLGYIAVTFADNAMTGAYGGNDPVPLSAVAFGGIVCYILFYLGVGITLGITPLVGELFVQNKQRESAHYLQSAIVLYTALGLAIMTLQLALEPMLYHLGQPREVVDMARPYYRLMSYSTLPAMLFGAFKQFLEGIGNTKVAMVILIFTNIVNIALNYIFIFGHCGFEAMGAFGAGLATLLSRILCPMIIVACFVARPRLRGYLRMFSRDNAWIANFKNLLRIGFPIAGQMTLEASAWVVTGIMMGWFGTEAISANQIGTTYGNCAFMMVLSLGSATTIRVAHCFGRHNIGQMRSAIFASVHLTLMWSVTVTSCFILLRHLMPLPFSDNAEVIALASQMIILYAAYQIPDSLQCVFVGVLRGMQDVKPIAYISFMAYVVLNIPVGYFVAFVLGCGSKGLITGYIVGLSTAAIFYGLRIRNNLRRFTIQGSRASN